MFQPEDSKERWWASFAGLDEKARKRLPLPGVAAGIEVRLYGSISERGSYGHMGMYDREFTITKLGAVTRASETTEEKP